MHSNHRLILNEWITTCVYKNWYPLLTTTQLAGCSRSCWFLRLEKCNAPPNWCRLVWSVPTSPATLGIHRELRRHCAVSCAWNLWFLRSQPRAMSNTAQEALPKGTVFLTGANGGLGVAMVKKIMSQPELAALYSIYGVRDASSSPALQSALSSPARSHPHDIVSLDLTRLEDVRKLAATVNTRVAAGEIPHIRALILNAAYL